MDVILIEVTSSYKQDQYLINEKEKEATKCVVCKEIIETVIVFCTNCVQYSYCSVECRDKDIQHISFHESLKKLSENNVFLEEIFDSSLDSLINEKSSAGKVGLKNLGNTCYLNSAIQCLSHTEDLTKYFLLSKFKDELLSNNEGNSQLVIEYNKMLRSMWIENDCVISPFEFRQILINIFKTLAGSSQQDCQEALGYLLDGLHEGLNRVKNKPYSEIKEKDLSETEDEASKRWWVNHLIRENSIITDLFHGQFKSEIYCLKCRNVSVTYDPFIFLSLPIPSVCFTIKIKVFPESLYEEIIYFDYQFSENSTIKELKNGIINSSPNLKVNLIFLLVKEFNFKKILKDNELILPLIEKNDYEIIVYSSENSFNDEINKIVIICPHKTVEESFLFFLKKEKKIQTFYPKPFIIPKHSTIDDFKYEVFKYYKKILYPKSGNDKTNFNKRNDEICNQKEFIEIKNSKDFKIKFLIFNNSNDSVFTQKNCEFCDELCDFCDFKFSDFDQINDIYKKLKNRKILVLYLEQYYDGKIYEIENSTILEKKSEITIYDCLNQFRLGENLSNENSWYCGNCKKPQEAFKKLDIYKAPLNLVVHLKRFKQRSGILSLNQKNDCHVVYPENLFDINNYVIDKSKDYKYELYGVSLHSGTMISGHYTAVCKSKEEWILYDDSIVKKVNKSYVCSPMAYLLFYRRKSS